MGTGVVAVALLGNGAAAVVVAPVWVVVSMETTVGVGVGVGVSVLALSDVGDVGMVVGDVSPDETVSVSVLVCVCDCPPSVCVPVPVCCVCVGVCSVPHERLVPVSLTAREGVGVGDRDPVVSPPILLTPEGASCWVVLPLLLLMGSGMGVEIRPMSCCMMKDTTGDWVPPSPPPGVLSGGVGMAVSAARACKGVCVCDLCFVHV